MYHRALKLIRVYHHLEQAELAGKLGLSKSYISELENDRKKPSREILESYSAFFKIPLSSLLLFAERTGSGTDEKVKSRRNPFSLKAIKMLEWFADIDGGQS